SKITDELSLTSRTSVDFSQSDRVFGRAPRSYLAIAVASGQPGVGEYGGFETQNNVQDFLISQNLGLRYRKTFGDKHDLSAGVYTEYIKAHYHAIAFTNNGLNPRQWVPGAGTGYIPFNPATPNIFQKTATAAEVVGGLFSYFGVLDYDYDKKYGISATLRRDASVRFIEENQWGTFWSVGARWNIDQESFMENSGFDMLKLRVSYGKQGNQNIAAVVPGANPFYAATNLTRDLYNSASQAYGNIIGVTL